MSINDAKCTFTSLRLATSITSGLFLTFDRFHAEMFSNFLHSLSTATASFAAGIFHRWRHGNKIVYKILMMQWTVTLPCNMVFMNSWLNSFHTHTDGLICFYYTCHLDLWSSFSIQVTPFRNFALLQGIAGTVCTSNFFRAFLIISAKSLSSGTMK